jgi:hypothetical protein
MNKTAEFYRPANIEFDVANSSVVPDNFGTFENEKAANEFIAKNLIGINQKISVNRFMDNFEKNELRKGYQEMLELKMPLLERELMKATAAHAEAKKNLADAQEIVNATTNEVKALANEVKCGVKVIDLDDRFTWRIPFDGKFHFFTYIDKQLKLCKISEILEHEKQELFNASYRNESFFNGAAEPEIAEEKEVKKSKAKSTNE